MDLAELRAFIAVVDTGSFLGAARLLRVSRTTLKRQITSLEARAGVPLLEAVRNGVVPTAAGQQLAQQGVTMMHEASALLASIRELGKEPSGTLRVVLPVGLPPHILAPLFSSMRAAHPRLSFHCRFSNDPISEALVDVDIAAHFGETPPDGNWISFVILRLPQWLIASSKYLAERGTPARLEDLKKHEILAWQAPGEDARILRLKNGGTFATSPAIVATDVHFIRHCCIAGLGIAFLPDALLPDPGLPEGELVPVLPDIVGTERAIRVSVPAVLAEVPKVKLVLDKARHFVGGL